MKKQLIKIGLFVFTLFFAANSYAVNEVAVKIYDGFLGTATHLVTIRIDAGQAASINLPVAAKRVNIEVASNFDDVGALTFTGGPTTGDTEVRIILGSGITFDALPPSIAVGNNWFGLDAIGLADSHLYGKTGGEILGDFIVNKIARLDVEDNIKALIQASGPHIANQFVIFAAGISQDGFIKSTTGDVKKIEIHGTMAGNINVAGDLNELIVKKNTLGKKGDVGTASGAPIRIDIGGNSGRILIDGTVHDNVTFDIVGTYAEFRTGESNPTNPVSPFNGEFNADGPPINPNGDPNNDPILGFQIRGDLSGSYEVNKEQDTQIIVTGNIASTGKIIIHDNLQGTNAGGFIQIDGFMQGLILIDGTLISTSWIEIIEKQGLTGQIIINADSTVCGVWNGTVFYKDATGQVRELEPWRFDLTAIQPHLAPAYEVSMSDLGGGAIGQAPFNFHQKDSIPVHDSTVFPIPIPVQIEFYGPVYDLSGTPSIKIEEKLTVGGQWADVTSRFDTFSESSPTTLVRFITIVRKPLQAGFHSNHSYRFSVIGDGLKCANVVGNPTVRFCNREDGMCVVSLEPADVCTPSFGPDEKYYRFSVGGFLMLNLNGDQCVDSLDVACWLAQPVDFNEDAAANVVDLNIMLDYITAP